MRGASLKSLLAAALLACAVPASAGWPSNLVNDGNAAIQQGKANGDPLEVIGGAIEKCLGALFGGHKSSPPPPPPPPPPSSQPGAAAAQGAAQQGSGGAGSNVMGMDGSGAPSSAPGNSGSTPAASNSQGRPGQDSGQDSGQGQGQGSGDSTGLVKRDDSGAAQGPQITYQGSSNTGGLINVHDARGHLVNAENAGAPSDAPAGSLRPAEGSSAQTVSAEAAKPKDTTLDKSVGPIAGVDDKGAKQLAQLLANAKSKLMVGDFKGAVEELTKAIALDPNNAAAYTKRAEAYNRLKQYDLALADALQASRLDPKSSPAFEQLAFAHYKLGHLKEALEAANHSIELDPNNATAYWIRAMIKAKMGDMAGALRDLETAANLSPKFRDAWERARESGKVTDDDDESTLGDLAVRRGLGLPLWAWALLMMLVLLAGTAAGVVALRAPKGAPAGALAREVIADPAAFGRLAGKYEMRGLIGKGGMGDVYEALDHTLGRTVAIKKISERLADMAPQARQMLVQEAKTVAQLHHPAIVDIYEILEDNGDLYLVFELVRGKTALHLLAESGRLPLPRVVELLRPVCQALEFAHGRGLIHRDLKPANVMLTEQGYVKLMDFGIARSLSDAPSASPSASPAAPAFDAAVQRDVPAFARTQTVVGTPQYMAPELEQGIVSPQGDVYALGVCLYELLTGRLPFSTTEQKLSPQLVKASLLAPGAPSAVDAVIEAALRPDPAQRTKSAREFLAALEAAAAAPANV